MKTLLNTVKKQNKVSTLTYILTYIASGFSIIFASSIVLEAKSFLNIYLFILLCAFLGYFLLINEKTKIDESRKQKPNKFRILIPFIVTFCSSVIGLYLFTNKSFESNINISNQKSELLFTIENKYQHKIDSINNLNYYATTDYNILNNQIKDYKKTRPIDTTERKFIATQIKNILTEISTQKLQFDNNKITFFKQISSLKTIELAKTNTNTNNQFKINGKNNFISLFFVILSMLLEFTIYTMNKNIGRKLTEIHSLTNRKEVKDYLLYRNMLNFIYEIYNNGDNIKFKTIQYSYFSKMNNLNYDNVKEIYDTFISVGILEKFIDIENLSENTELVEAEQLEKKPEYSIKFDKRTALKRFDNCFQLILN